MAHTLPPQPTPVAACNPVPRVLPHVPGANAQPMAATRVTTTKGARLRVGAPMPLRPKGTARPTGGAHDLPQPKARKRRKRGTVKPAQPTNATLHAAWARGTLY